MSFLLTLSLLFALFTDSSAFAQTLLIPDTTVLAENYTEKCELEGYICMGNFQFKNIAAESTPQFDSLIDSLDLSNKSFLGSLPKKIQSILQDESISTDQLEMLVRLLEQIQTEQSRLLLNELNFVAKLVQKDQRIVNFNQDFIVFFKVPMKKSNLLKIKKSLLALPYYEVSFNKEIQKKTSTGKQIKTADYLVTGSCENAVTSIDSDSVKWKIMSEKSCGWTKNFTETTTTVYKKAKQNKGWIVTGALLISAALLANQYEIKFEF